MIYQNFEKTLEQSGELGFVDTFESPIIHVRGLPSVFLKEVVVFENGSLGQVLSLGQDSVEVLTLSKGNIEVGSKVTRTERTLEIPLGKELLGHVITPFGESLYEDQPLVLKSPEYRSIDVPATGIVSRYTITKPLETGVTVVDMMIPLGKGQRELVVGDRKTGKTEFLLQSMLTQAKKGVICIYTCIGKSKSEITKVENFIKSKGLVYNSIIIATNSLDSLGSIYTTPYSAMTIAEYFRDLGNDVLLFLDDLTTHAKYYRELSLIGKRFPGRNSYPGDIFYIHSRLLERSGNFITDRGVFSISCLAVGETLGGDMSGYIITNLMSVADGHIFFDDGIFNQGRRPAVNYFVSVTRVGRQTQTKLRWNVSRELSTVLGLLEKAQVFAHFGAEISEGVRSTLNIGNRILDFFNQPMAEVVPLELQLFIFGAIWSGLLKNVDNELVMKHLVEDALSNYSKDKNFKSFVEHMVNSHPDFNSFLGGMRASVPQVLGFLNVSYGNLEQEGNK